MEGQDIEALIHTSMQSLRDILDVNTVIGDIIESDSGIAVIPVAKVTCGFLAGGGGCDKKKDRDPFYGGSGAGLNVQPVCFLVISGDQVRMIPICGSTALDKAIEAVPLVANQLQGWLDGRSSNKDDTNNDNDYQ